MAPCCPGCPFAFPASFVCHSFHPVSAVFAATLVTRWNTGTVLQQHTCPTLHNRSCVKCSRSTLTGEGEVIDCSTAVADGGDGPGRVFDNGMTVCARPVLPFALRHHLPHVGTTTQLINLAHTRHTPGPHSRATCNATPPAHQHHGRQSRRSEGGTRPFHPISTS